MQDTLTDRLPRALIKGKTRRSYRQGGEAVKVPWVKGNTASLKSREAAGETDRLAGSETKTKESHG
jgi:hypothetical protein